MTEMRAWKLRPWSDDKTVREISKTGKVRLHYEVPGLRLGMIREELIEVIRTHNPDRFDKGGVARAGQLVALFGVVTEGDLAVVSRDKGKSMMIGEITSERPDVSRTIVKVKARLIDQEIPLSPFDQGLRYSFMAIHKFCGVSWNNAPARLRRSATGETDPGFSR